MLKQLFRQRKHLLAATLFIACLVGPASAWKIPHVHTTVGGNGTEQTTPFTAAYTGNYYVGGKAPTIGGLSTSMRLDGDNIASCATAHGGVCCDKELLTDDENYEFFSPVHVMQGGGVGKCYVWDKFEPNDPVYCPDGLPN